MNVLYVSLLTTLIYLLIVFDQSRQFFSPKQPRRWAYILGSLLALSLHGLLVYRAIEMPNGQNLVWPVLFACVLWFIGILNFLCAIEKNSHRLSIIIYPIAIVSLWVMRFYPKVWIVDTSEDVVTLVHIFASLIAVSFILLSSCWAAILGYQNYLLKSHSHAKALLILPPVQSIEKNLFNIMWLGALFLSASLLTGFFDNDFNAELMRSKTIMALVGWSLFMLLLLGHTLWGWRGMRAVKYTFVAAGMVTFSYFSGKFLNLII